jgi:hypothetical protein
VSRGFCIVTSLLSFLLSLTEVAAVKMWRSTAPVGTTRGPVPGLVRPLTLPRMSPELALSTYELRAARQSAELASYSATTVVRAELSESSQHGEFELERRYTAPHSLEFKVVKFAGDNFVKGNVILRLLRSEVDHVRKDDPALTAITSGLSQ